MDSRSPQFLSHRSCATTHRWFPTAARHLGRLSLVTAFRYAGRFGDDDSTPGQVIVSRVAAADIAYIDDPLSFPWELLDEHARSCPLVVDVSDCTPDALAALRPALSVLTEHDIVTHSSDPNSPVAERLARQVGATYSATAPSDMASHITKARKGMQHDEDTVIGRVTAEWQALVVDFEDLGSIDWLSTEWTDSHDERPAALAVRIPGETIRSISIGFHAFGQWLLSATACTAVAGIWGIREHAGSPLDRAVVVLAKGRA